MSVDSDVLVSNLFVIRGRGWFSGCQFLTCPPIASRHRMAVLLIPCGQIAGGYYGLSGVPEAWREKLYIGKEIEELGNELYAANRR